MLHKKYNRNENGNTRYGEAGYSNFRGITFVRALVTITFCALLSLSMLSDELGGFSVFNNAGHLPTLTIFMVYVALFISGIIWLKKTALFAVLLGFVGLFALALISPDKSRAVYVVIMNFLLV